MRTPLPAGGQLDIQEQPEFQIFSTFCPGTVLSLPQRVRSWPHRPVETVDPRCFVPPHCPWPACTAHRDTREFRFYRHSSYFRRCDQRRVPRFVCRPCGRSFSQQCFSFTYYLKRPELAPAIAAALLAGSAHRQIARSLGCAPSTVTRLSARLGRHALLLLALSLERLERI